MRLARRAKAACAVSNQSRAARQDQLSAIVESTHRIQMALKALKNRLVTMRTSAVRQLDTSGGAFNEFYLSQPWRELRAKIINERGPHCEKCSATGKVIADHIVELKDGGAYLDKRNIQLLCPQCHAKKTGHEARKRMAWTPPPKPVL